MRKWLFFSACFIGLNLGFLFASSADSGTRTLSKEGTNYILERAKKEASASLKYAARSYSEQTVYYSLEDHFITALSAIGDSVQIEDGSVFKIKESFGVSMYWKSQDMLLITQNHSWMSSYPYRIYNRMTNESVEAKLHLGPMPSSPNILFVSYVDYMQKEIVLSNATRWVVSFWDMSLVNEWQVGDAVIIGTSTSRISSKKNILINVALDSYIRASQVEGQ